jgi:hypothetical protein
MPPPKIVLHQGLVVRSIRHERAHVRVEVADGNGVQHWIQFSFADVEAATARAETLERWQRSATPLTYVKARSEGALIDEVELLRRAVDIDRWPDSTAF